MKQQVSNSVLNLWQLVRKILRCACLTTGIVLSLLYLNHAIYCAWLAEGPPTPYPAAWWHQALASLAYALAALIGSIALYRGVGQFPCIRKSTWILIAICLCLCFVPLTYRLILQDKCLDNGGDGIVGLWNVSAYEYP